MRPDKLTIHDVFEKERRYVIPLYQRSYVWNQEEQWEPLWDDIRQQAERCLDDDSQRERCRSRFIHTIGNLTLLTQGLNAAASNGSFPAKRKQIASNSDLRLKAWLRSNDRQSW